MSSKYKIRRQAPIKGGRESLPAAVIADIERAVQAEAHKHRVSKSWVIATILAYHFGIEEQVSYLPQPKAKHLKIVR